jgi:WD40 repeat protein
LRRREVCKEGDEVAADVSITVLDFSGDSKFLLSASEQGAVQIWDPSPGTCQATLLSARSNSPAKAVAFGPSGGMGAIVREDRAVRLFSLTMPASHTLCPSGTEFTKDVEYLKFLEDGVKLACRTHLNTLSFWSVPLELFSHAPEGDDPSEVHGISCAVCDRL